MKSKCDENGQWSWNYSEYFGFEYVDSVLEIRDICIIFSMKE